MILTPTTFGPEREALHERMAKAYHGFLTYLFRQNRDDADLHTGTAEFRNKFLSCYHIAHAGLAPIFLNKPKIVKSYDKPGVRRYLIADYYSKAALHVLHECQPLQKKLRFEHVVPKAEALQRECESRILDKYFDFSDIKTLLNSNWHTAVVTHDEEKELYPRSKMPKEWETHPLGVLSRYERLSKVENFRLYRSVEDYECCAAVLDKR